MTQSSLLVSMSLLMVAAGCSQPASVPQGETALPAPTSTPPRVEPSAAPSAVRPAVVQLPSTSKTEAGPVASASLEARKAAVRALLAGGEPAVDLPERAVEPGTEMDPNLIDRVARGTVPTVLLGAATVQGSLSPEVIRRIVRQHLGRFRYCYEKGLEQDPDIDGGITARFVISPEGFVINAQLQPEEKGMKDPTVLSCVTAVIRSLSFPKPDPSGSVTVSYPMVFTMSSTSPSSSL